MSRLRDDLARSGIDYRYIKKLGFRTLNHERASKFLGFRTSSTLVCYEIPFFDVYGKQTSFSRLRLLKGKWYRPRPGKKPKPFRYNQKSNTAPRVYFPPIFPWAKHMKDGKIQLPYLCITEGEKKAIKACLMGIPTIALAGVYNFKSKKRGISLIKDFKLFDLTGTEVEICYDSDLNSNEHVREAINTLNAELITLKPKSIATVLLDGDSTDKKGLDDFLCAYDTRDKAREAFRALPRERDERSDILKNLDANILFINENGQFFLRDTERFATRQSLIDRYEPLPEIPDPNDSRKLIAPIKLWFRQRAKHTDVKRVVYEPARPRRFQENGTALDSYNLWIPTGCAPAKGTPEYWLELFNNMAKNLSDENRRWWMQWFAYPIQHPGTKLYTATFVYSHTQGVGKNFLITPLISGIYGDSFTLQTGQVLLENFNGWVAKRQFVFLDEVYLPGRKERKAIMGKLNSLITGETITVNEKFQPQYTVNNYANLYFTSNHADAIPMDVTDRRFFVVNPPEKRMSTDFFRKMDAWAKTSKASGQLLRYLLEDVDTADFDPRAMAPLTKAKERTVVSSADNSIALANYLVRDPSLVLSINGKLPTKELWTAEELSKALNRYANEIGITGSLSPQSLGSILANIFPRARYRRVKVRLRDHVLSINLYAVLNSEAWSSASAAEWIAHYKAHDQRWTHPGNAAPPPLPAPPPGPRPH